MDKPVCFSYTINMDAQPYLIEIARTLNEVKLEAVMIGNSAAALQGAPVTTLDIDFMFRKTNTNLKKLKRFADCIGGIILKPFYPVSGLYRVIDDERDLQVDFMTTIHGISSFESLRSDAVAAEFGGFTLYIADLKKIIQSKKALGRDKDLAIIRILEKTLEEKGNQTT